MRWGAIAPYFIICATTGIISPRCLECSHGTTRTGHQPNIFCASGSLENSNI